MVARITTENQFGFLKGRNIEECIISASKRVNLLDKKSVGGNIAMKINIRKTFDSMRWSFVLSVLRRFRFSRIFCN